MAFVHVAKLMRFFNCFWNRAIPRAASTTFHECKWILNGFRWSIFHLDKIVRMEIFSDESDSGTWMGWANWPSILDIKMPVASFFRFSKNVSQYTLRILTLLIFPSSDLFYSICQNSFRSKQPNSRRSVNPPRLYLRNSHKFTPNQTKIEYLFSNQQWTMKWLIPNSRCCTCSNDAINLSEVQRDWSIKNNKIKRRIEWKS